MDYQDKVVVVTGGSKGIGLACAKQFVARGAKVIISSRTQANINEALAVLPGASGFSANLSDEEEAAALVNHIQQKFGHIDVLVNSAGAAKRTPVAELNPASWRAAMDAKFSPTINVLDPVIKLMAARGQGVHNLKEVNIKGITNHLPPEIHPITLVEQRDYDNLAQYLLYMINGAKLENYLWNKTVLSRHIIQGGKYGHWVGLEASYADGTPIKTGDYPDEDFLTQPMRNIIKVTFNKNRYGDIISVSLILRNGVMEPKSFFDNTTADMVGYYKAREFYKPTQEELNNNLDTRVNTIYWEPNIITNDKGEAIINFNNTIQTGKLRLVVQGITNNGYPLAVTSVYEVK